ncbi:hypothetical protein ONE63_000143 [Megalurothrips usitatus]|uniref:C3H1-type domain-containing protein n=1 Tax=Megalurothrips usitatus TaxID=439358 RepID=A0AAV7Y0K8_9NEOP|nr:hypothetical protein ONE63_000143 [Megalurothrips usitatus]
MDSDNSSDGELNVRSGEYASSDDEKSSGHADSNRRRTPHSPPDSPEQEQSPLSSPTRRSHSKSPSHDSSDPSKRPQRRTPSGSPPRRSLSGSPTIRSRSGSSRRSPSGSPLRQSPSGSSSRHSPSGSPSRRSPSKSPSKHLASRRSKSRTPEKESPRSKGGDSGPRQDSPPGSPAARRSFGSRHSDRESYSRRAHGKKSKRRVEEDGQLSDASDDGRSNISSTSSFGDTPESKKGPARLENGDQKEKGKFEPHKAEDLSDVSDLDGSLDSLSDDESSRKKKIKDESRKSPSPVRTTHSASIRKDIVSHSDEMEQLDFEAEEPQAKEDKEDGECAEAIQASQAGRNTEAAKAKPEADEGEVNNEEEVEEGEITDEDENRPEETEPRPICRFYNRGQCTWGSSCRFLHPGVTDKGNYTMFDMVRPLVPTNGPPMYGPMADYRAPIERPMMPPAGPAYSSRKEDAPAVESAWERGLRTAKEMMRKASKRKETDMDFEEKKMNLSLGQDELDKENDYYTRPASPALEDDLDRWSRYFSAEGKHHRMVVSDRYDVVDPYYGYHRDGRDRWGRGHYDDPREAYGREHMYDGRHPGSHHEPTMAYRAHMHGSSHHEAGYYPDKYERKKKSHTVREVIVQHTRKPSYKDEKSGSGPNRGRGDEWADPWMRSKSPNARKSRPTRRQSYSSGSSYSSSRSSRSSYSSYYSRSGSRSRSRSKSRSGSGSRSRSRSPRHPSQPLRRTGAGAGAGAAAGAGVQRAQRRNAPDPRARGSRLGSPDADKRSSAPAPRKPRPPSPAAARKAGPNLASGPGRVAGKVRLSKSSRSSSSDSSGSSSDSSETSLSSSSSSRDQTPPPKPKNKIQMDERLMAQSTKIKAMDALKLSGQKQQIKLTLKTQGSNATNTPDERRSAVVAGKKRPAETPPPESPSKASATVKPPAKKTTSRREELLKQLKAVEDAIARKRSKIT